MAGRLRASMHQPQTAVAAVIGLMGFAALLAGGAFAMNHGEVSGNGGKLLIFGGMCVVVTGILLAFNAWQGDSNDDAEQVTGHEPPRRQELT